MGWRHYWAVPLWGGGRAVSLLSSVSKGQHGAVSLWGTSVGQQWGNVSMGQGLCGAAVGQCPSGAVSLWGSVAP